MLRIKKERLSALFIFLLKISKKIKALEFNTSRMVGGLLSRACTFYSVQIRELLVNNSINLILFYLVELV